MTQPSYAFNASAAGLGGVIRQGNRTTVIPTLASVCLAGAGGEASNTVDDYSRDGISFTRAQTRVGGYSSNSGRTHTTFADVLLLNLRIFDRISIARMQAVVTSKREIEFNEPLHELAPDRTSFWITLLYHGVEIDGEELELEVDRPLCETLSYSRFADELKLRKDRLLQETRDLLDAHETLRQSPMNAPLVRCPSKPEHANRIPVRGFGHARFGDAIVKPDRQRVSLLRLTLDGNWSPEPFSVRQREPMTADFTTMEEGAAGDGGNVSSDGGTNGVPIWP